MIVNNEDYGHYNDSSNFNTKSKSKNYFNSNGFVNVKVIIIS